MSIFFLVRMTKSKLAWLAGEVQALKEQGKQIVVVQRERDIPRFSEDGPTDFAEFDRQIRLACLERPGITEEEKVDLVWSNLSPFVQDEVLCHPPQTRKTADGVLGIVRTQFGDKRTLNQLIYEFHSVVQHPVEGVREFSHRLNKAYLALVRKQEEEEVPQTEERILRDVFVSQLNDSFLRGLLRERVHRDPGRSFLQIRDEAIRWTEDSPSETVSVQAVSSESPLLNMVESLTQKVTVLMEEVKALKSERSQGNRGNVRGSEQQRAGSGSNRLQGRQGQSKHFVRDCPVLSADKSFLSDKASVCVSPVQLVVPHEQENCAESDKTGQKRRRRRRRRRRKKQKASQVPTFPIFPREVSGVDGPIGSRSSRKVTLDKAGELQVSVDCCRERNPLGEFVPELDSDESDCVIGLGVQSQCGIGLERRVWNRGGSQVQNQYGDQSLNSRSSGVQKVQS